MKKINLNLFKITKDEIIAIKSKNTSVKEIFLNVEYKIEDAICDFQNKFQNLNKLEINIKNSEKSESQKTIIKIEENPNSKVKNLNIRISKKNNYKILCLSYQTLESIRFDNYAENSIMMTVLPIFNDKCDIIFKSLQAFHFYQCYAKDINILKNIYKNLDNMPYLIDFFIEFRLDDISSKFYKRFIEKVLSMKLIRIIYINIGSYFERLSKTELKKIFPKINFNKFTEINIYKRDYDNCSII